MTLLIQNWVIFKYLIDFVIYISFFLLCFHWIIRISLVAIIFIPDHGIIPKIFENCTKNSEKQDASPIVYKIFPIFLIECVCIFIIISFRIKYFPLCGFFNWKDKRSLNHIISNNNTKIDWTNDEEIHYFFTCLCCWRIVYIAEIISNVYGERHLATQYEECLKSCNFSS